MLARRVHLIGVLGALVLVLTGIGVVQVAVAPQPASAVAAHRVLITGDSITQGSSGDYTWRYRLWNKLAQTAPGDVAFVGPRTDLFDNVNNTQGSQHYAAAFSAKAHAAVWGTTFLAQLDNVAGQVSNAGANVLVVQLGFNDLAYHTTPAQTIANARTYIQRARNAAPGLDVVIGEVTHRYDFFGNTYELTTQTSQYATLLAGLASDLNTSSERVVVAHTKNGWDPKVHTWDGVHPNSTGETLIAQRVSEALAQLGAGTASPNIFQTTPWAVEGPTPTVTAGIEKATVGWSRVSTGSTAMFVHFRIANINQGWQRLDYAVFQNDYWTMAPLVAGGTFQFATSPSKGFMTGDRGPAEQRVIPAEPFEQTVPSISALELDAHQPPGVVGFWTSANNAQSYLLGYRTMSINPDQVELPYPVGANVNEWDLYPLAGGRYHRFIVKPVRGFVEGTWKAAPNVRVRGVANGRAHIALGDSYSSGLGIWQDVEQYELHVDCRRTAAAWPFDLQSSWNVATKLVACQGDKIDGVRAQLASIHPFFASYPKAPQLITVTVGGNDAGFVPKFKQCMATDCTILESEWTAEITALGWPLHQFYDDLRDAAPDADIIVGGYPHLLEPGGLKQNAICSIVRRTKGEMMVRLVDKLNAVIHEESEGSIRTGVHKSEIWSAGAQVTQRFSGHGACQYGDDEWIHSYTTGGGMDGPAGKNTLHPKDYAQLPYAYGFADALMEEVE